MFGFEKSRKIKKIIDRMCVIMLIISMIFGSTHIPTIFGGGVATPSIATNLEEDDNNSSDINILSEESENTNLSDLRNFGDFEYIVEDGKAVITGLKDTFFGDRLEIPATFDGVEITKIKDRAFYFKNLREVVLGSNLVEIGAYAFAGNNIENIDFPDSLKEIAESAFRDNKLSNVNLKNIKKVGAESFINNSITALDLGVELVEIGNNAFKNNDISEVNFPATLERVGENIFADNKKYVRVSSDNNENVGVDKAIPTIQSADNAFGYVINPIKVQIKFIDKDTNKEILDSITVGDDLSSPNNVYVKGSLQRYTPPSLSGYKLYTDNGENIENIEFTPNETPFLLNVYYTKKFNEISLVRKSKVVPILAVNEPNVEEKLRSFIEARDEQGNDLSAQVEINPKNVDVSTSGVIHDILYSLLDTTTGQTKYLSLKVPVGTDMREFPLGKNWVLGDFIYGGDPGISYRDTSMVCGFSAQGLEKLKTNKEVVLPHINPNTGDTIVAIAANSFKDKDFISVESFEDGIKTIKDSAFRDNTALRRVNITGVKIIEESAFHNDSKLEEFDFSKVTNIDSYAFSGTSLKKLIAPELTSIDGNFVFSGTKIGSDPEFPDGIYLPKLSYTRGSYIFGYTSIKYIDQEKQFPKLNKIQDRMFYSIRILEKIKLSKATIIEDSAFAFNNIKDLDLPEVTRIDKDAFLFNSIKNINLPKVTVIGKSAFERNNLEELNLPKVTSLEEGAFEKNKIVRATLPNISKIGNNVFFNGGRINYDGVPKYNPGLKSLNYFIPIFTNNSDIPSNENYIINPSVAIAGQYEDDDFIWDAIDSSKVLGFSTKGKAKFIANNFELKLPDRAKRVGEYAFANTSMRSIIANKVKVVEKYGFSSNNIENLEMPELERAEMYSFNMNYSNRGVDNLNLPKLKMVGDYAFNTFGIESLDIPLLEIVADSSFAKNKIKKINASSLIEVGNEGFSNNEISEINVPKLRVVATQAFEANKISKITKDTFPSLEWIEDKAFKNNPIIELDLPKLKYFKGSEQFIFDKYSSNRSNPIIWSLAKNTNIRGIGYNEFGDNTFSYIYNGKDNSTIEPAAIIFTNEPRADGTLDRSNIRGYKESFKTTTYNSGSTYIQTKYRTAVIDPSSVKINYRLDDGNKLDGLDGRPRLDDYREYIYEEKDRILATGQFKENKTYEAPDVSGYILVSSTDQNGNIVKGRNTIELPYEAEGARTDREITFTYKKIEKELTNGPVLKYGIVWPADSTNLIPEKEYQTTGEYNQPMPQMLTRFDITEVKKNIKNGKIKISFDNPYIDPKSIVISNSDASSQWYDENSWKATDTGLEIKLKELVTAKALNSSIAYRFKPNVTPDNAVVNLKMSLISENDNGEEQIISESEDLRLRIKYLGTPSFKVNYPNNLSGYYYGSKRDYDDGPRNMGELVGEQEHKKIAKNPRAGEFYYTVDDIKYNISAIHIDTILPKYKVVNERGEEEERTAIFDENLNPDWKLSEDGKRVILDKILPYPMRESSSLNASIPKLKLKFPDLAERQEITNTSYMTLVPSRDFRDANEYKPIVAMGRYQRADALTIYPLGDKKLEYNGKDIRVGKISVGKPRRSSNDSYLYDTSEDRKKDIDYELDIYAANEQTDYKDISIIDYGLDQRLKYTGLEFAGSSKELDNSSVSIRGYKKQGNKINPTVDALIFEKQALIDKSKSIVFGDFDVDYIKIDLLNTEEKAFNKDIKFIIHTRVKNPDDVLLTTGASEILENHALFIGNIFGKDTTLAQGTRESEEKYEGIDRNSIIDTVAKVSVKKYKMNFGIKKTLYNLENPSSYPIYPSDDTGEVVLEGQRGAYHIYLDAYLDADKSDRKGLIINDFELIDVVPDPISISRNDILLSQEFIKNQGSFEIIPEYEVLENGVNVKHRAIKFKASKFDLSLYKGNLINIASIKTRYVGETFLSRITNKIYATCSNDNVEFMNPAKIEGRKVDPKGVELDNNKNEYAYAEAGIKVVPSSSLVGGLYIRNLTDRLWQESIPTKNEEKFDYKMTLTNYDRSSEIRSYMGMDIINVLPSKDDYMLNKEGLRGTNLEGVKVDTSRLSELKAPDGYELEFYNGDKTAKELLSGNKTMDDVVNDPSIIWESTATDNTKMIRLKAKAGISFSHGHTIEVIIPMVAPHLTGLDDIAIGKKAVDSFVFRFLKYDAPDTYSRFVELNRVNNYMETPDGSISFKKFAKDGQLTDDSQARGLEGAAFKIVDKENPNEIIKVAYSDSEGNVSFNGLLVNKNYIISEMQAPEGYIISNRTIEKGKRDFEKVKDNGYAIEISDADSKAAFMNIKNIKGSLTIKKVARDNVTPLSNVEFNIRGRSTTNREIDIRVATNIDGIAFVDNLSEGIYSIEEISSSAANRYQVVSVDSVNINENRNFEKVVVNDKFRVLLRKIAVNDENLLSPENWNTLTDFQKKKLEGYKFRILGDDGSNIETGYTDNNGNVFCENLKTEVVYTVTEAPVAEQINTNKNLYKHNTNQYKFKITHDGKLMAIKADGTSTRFKQYALNIPNMTKEIRGRVIVRKLDKNNTNKVLSGAKLAIYRLELDSGTEEISNHVSLEQVGEVKTTGEDGTVIFENLLPGNYQVKELEAPSGYVLESKPIDVYIPKDVPENNNKEYDKTGENIIYTINKELLNISTKIVGIKGSDIEGFKNIPLSAAKIYINSKKKDNPNLKYRIIGDGFATVYQPIEGAKFELYKMENGVKVGNPIAVDSSKPNETTIISDEDGNINFGDYKFDFNTQYGIFETVAAEGYRINGGYKTFKLSDEIGKLGFNGSYSFYINNDSIKGEISISKYDSVAKKNLEGVTFNLYKGSKDSADFTKVYKSIVTGADGIAYFSKLAFGDYVLREADAPKGYKKLTENDDIEVKLRATKGVDDDGPIVKKKILNARLVNISVTKKWDKGSEKSVKIKLLRSRSKVNLDNGEPVIVKNLTDNNGIITLSPTNNWTVKYENIDMADSNGNIYYFKPVEVEVREGESVDAEYTGSLDKEYDYNSIITGTPEFGFTITNTAKNTTAIGVTKVWDFGKIDETKKEEILSKAKVEVALKKVKQGSVLPAATDVTEDLGKHEFLDARQDDATGKMSWQHIYKDLELRHLGENIVYRVEEVGNIAGFKPVSAASYTYDEANKNITIKNEAITRNINVEKKWEGVNNTDVPRISVSIFDSEDMTKPIESKELSVKQVVEEGKTLNKYIAEFTKIPSYSYTVSDSGEISAKAIKYVFKETYYDDEHPEGYRDAVGYKTSVSMRIGDNINLFEDSDIAYNTYKEDANISEDINVNLTNKLATTDIKINKTWKGIAPDLAPEIKVKLVDYTDDMTRDHSDETRHIDIKTNISLNAGNAFTVSINDLPKYKADGLTKIKYGVVEVTDKDIYDLSTNSQGLINKGGLVSGESTELDTGKSLISFNLINSRKTVKANLSKIWELAEGFYEDANAEKPEVNLHLWAVTDDDIDNKTPAKYLSGNTEIEVGNIVLNKDNNYKKIIENLPRYTNDGAKAISYYVTEDTVVGFKPISKIIKLELNDNNELAATIKNIQEKLTVNVEKHWIGLEKYGNTENIPQVHINLYDVTDSANKKLIKSDEPVIKDKIDANLWSLSFTDLPKYYLDGRKIKYSVEESERLEGYETEVGNPEDIDNGIKFNITNTAKNLDVIVNKIWELKNEDSVKVKLLQNGKVIKTQNIVANTEGEYTHTFKNLPMYSIEGNTKYIYTIEEEAIKGYDTPKIVQEENVDSNNSNIVFNITNTYKTVDINISKKWIDVDEKDRPQISLNLLDITADTTKDHSDKSKHIEVKTGLILNKDNAYTIKLDNLPKYKEDGKTLIKYSVVETSNSEAYHFSVKSEFDDKPSMDAPFGTWSIEATNERVQQDLEIQKVWKDDRSKYKRPNIRLTLLKDETDNGIDDLVEVEGYTNIELKAEDGWKLKTKVPKYTKDGRTLIKYYVKELAVSGYNVPNGNIPLKEERTLLGKTILKAKIENTLITTKVYVEQTYEGLDIYKNESLVDLPKINVDLYDITDSTHPIKLNDVKTLIKKKSSIIGLLSMAERTPKWVTVYEDLPKFKEDGITEIKYSIGDITTFDGYEQSDVVRSSTAEGYTLLSFIEKPKSIKLNVEKRWIDIDKSTAPKLEFKLLDKDNINDIKQVGDTISLGKDTGWKYEFSNLAKYHIDGRNVVRYAFEELGNRAGYEFNEDKYEVGEDKISVILTNRKSIEKAIIKKLWDNKEDEYTRPSATFSLYVKSGEKYNLVSLVRDGKDYRQAGITDTETTDKFILNKDNVYTTVINDLSKTDDSGEKLLEYYIKEEPVRGYVVPSDYIKLENMDRDTIYAEPKNIIEKRNIKVEKKWKGLENYSEEELKNITKVHAILFEINSDNKKIKLDTLEIEKDEKGRYEAIFKDLPKYKSDGVTPIIYAIEELEAGDDAFSTEIEKKDEDTYEIVNTLKEKYRSNIPTSNKDSLRRIIKTNSIPNRDYTLSTINISTTDVSTPSVAEKIIKKINLLIPKTGDTSNSILYVGILIVAGLFFIVLVLIKNKDVQRKRRKRKE